MGFLRVHNPFINLCDRAHTWINAVCIPPGAGGEAAPFVRRDESVAARAKGAKAKGARAKGARAKGAATAGRPRSIRRGSRPQRMAFESDPRAV